MSGKTKVRDLLPEHRRNERQDFAELRQELFLPSLAWSLPCSADCRMAPPDDPVLPEPPQTGYVPPRGYEKWHCPVWRKCWMWYWRSALLPTRDGKVRWDSAQHQRFFRPWS